MTEIKSVHLPDLGTEEAVEVIEIAVSLGSAIEKEDTLLTLESEKASMDVPAPFPGKVKALKVTVGDKVKTGDLILELEVPDSQSESVKEPSNQGNVALDKVSSAKSSNQESMQKSTPQAVSAASTSPYSIVIPDIGTEDLVSIIELNIKKGDSVTKETVLLTLESEKASMELPSPVVGVVESVNVKEGQKVKQGDLIATALLSATEGKIPEGSETSKQESPKEEKPVQKEAVESKSVELEKSSNRESSEDDLANHEANVYASPAVRRLAREFGADLTKVSGTGRKHRILAMDVQRYIKRELQGSGTRSSSSTSSDLFVMPKIDFSKFGKTSEEELSRIKAISAQNLHRNWVNIPHVTQFDEADITDMEEFRQAHKEEVAKNGYKLTPIVFLMKAVVAALKEFPLFNTSLSACGTKLIQKYYYNIGIAVDTPHGLVVPVIKEVDQKGLFTLAEELTALSQQARALKMTPAQMQGSCFTISSLGGIGGTGFTPIINAPDVAILGVAKSEVKPVFINEAFQPRLLLPLALSYDHRVIDGAQAARFITFLASRLKDLRCLLL